MVICICSRVNEEQIRSAAKSGLNKEQITELLNCMQNCRSCEDIIEQIIDDHKQTE